MAFKVSPKDAHPITAKWYREYTQSPKWKKFKATIYAKRGDMCEDCKINKAIVLHHITYARVTKELLRDVRLLCSDCHYSVHKLHNIPCLPYIYEEDKEKVFKMMDLFDTWNEPKFEYPALR